MYAIAGPFVQGRPFTLACLLHDKQSGSSGSLLGPDPAGPDESGSGSLLQVRARVVFMCGKPRSGRQCARREVSPLGHDTRDQLGWRHIKGRIDDLRPSWSHAHTTMPADLLRAALFDGDRRSIC